MHLSYQEHEEIYSGICAGLSIRHIANSIGRYPSTVAREVARNSDEVGYLYPKEAYDRQFKKRGQRTKKIDRHSELREYVIEKLHEKWPPKVIAGRWNRLYARPTITHECLYQWIYSNGNEHLKKLLPRAKKKRGLPRKKQKKSKLPYRKELNVRPEEANNRSVNGHFEADLVFYKGSMSANVLTAIDRKSRFSLIVKNKTKRSGEVIGALKKMARNLNSKSFTFDNGTEFTQHYDLTKEYGIDTYFCDPGKPWQKGSIENFNKLLREHLPFDVTHHEITQERLDAIAYKINHKPRESLEYLTPCEAFNFPFQEGNSMCCIL